MPVPLGYPIKVVVRRTGLTPHVIRMWEKRYRAVIPQRTQTNRRLYTEADITRLALLRRATLAGHSISQIARLSTEELLPLVRADTVENPELPHNGQAVDPTSPTMYLEACLEAAQRLDAEALEATCMRAAVACGQAVLLEKIIVPLMEHIGESWRDGKVRIAHEHLTSVVVRTFLESMRGAFKIPSSAPSMVVTTPAGQLHEFGALIAAFSSAAEGWRVTYLGPNLPAEEIAGAARQVQARVVCLSIVYPPDDPHLAQELLRIRRYLTDDVMLMIGGRAAGNYHLEMHGTFYINNLSEFRGQLESLRKHISLS